MSGIDVRAALEELGIDRDSHRVLGLLPLVYVAWADGKIQRAERATIMGLARDKGWLAGSAAKLLETWLAEPPSSEYMRKGLTVLAAIAGQERGVAAGSVDADLLQHLVAYSRNVANAAGGLFGAGGAISDDEAAALDTIARAFGFGDDKGWQQVAEDADAHAHALPPGPRGHFLLGNLPALMREPLATLLQARTHGDVVWLRAPGMRMALVWRPEHIEHVLVDRKDNYLRGRDYDALGRVVGESLLTTDGERWRKLRRISQPAFHHKHLAGMANVIVDRTDRMLGRWSTGTAGQTVDIADEMMRVTFEVIGLLAFSTDLGDASSEIGDAVNVALHHATKLMNTPIRLPQSLPTPENRRFAQAIAVFDKLVYAKIAERRALPEQQHPTDLLSLMMAARDEETGEAFDDRELRDEILTMLIAGHETTALALTWTLYLLSKHPTVLRPLHAEISHVLGAGPPTLAHVKQLVYTQRVVDESMRLYPPAPVVSRTSVAEDRIGGYVIPKGTEVVFCPWVTHRSPELWPNPEGFDPDRFEPAEVAKRPKHAYFPFLAGPHKCIGAPLAMMELHLILPRILQHFRIDLVPGFEPGLDAAVTLRLRDGMKMTLHPIRY